jgi:tetratricopeptide (TPR) repeat protein
VLALCAATCGPNPVMAPRARFEVRPVTLPDLSNADPSLQARIRDADAALRVVAARPDVEPATLADAYGDMGRLLLAAEYLDAAEVCFGNARGLAPDDMRWAYFLGHVFRFRNDAVQAEGHFARAVDLAPNDVPSLVRLADVRIAQGRPDAAEPLLVRARTLEGKNAAVLFGLGRIALAKADFAQAVALLEDALALAPHATVVHYPLALAYRGLGDRTKAEAHLRLRGEVEPAPPDPLLDALGGLLDTASAHETRGSKALDERRWTDAVEHLRKAVELAPDNAFTRLNLGTALYMTDDATGALAELRAAVRLSPRLARAHYVLGVVAAGQGQEAESIAAFTRAVDDDAAYADAHLALADALRRTGRVTESLPHYTAAMASAPLASQARFGYAIGLVRLKRWAEAGARLDEGAKSFPDQPGFEHALARVLAAAPDGRVRDGERAVAIMERLTRDQQSLSTSETMAMALAEVGRFDEAARWQRNAIEVASQSGRLDVLRRLAVNLRSYENRRPCRVPWTDDDPIHRPAHAQ